MVAEHARRCGDRIFIRAIRLYDMIEIKKIAENYSYDIHAINYEKMWDSL